MENYLKNIYFDINSSASFSSVYKLYKEVKIKYPDVTINQVKNWLSKQFPYTLHKPARRIFKRNRYLVSRINEQWQCNLIDFQKFSRQNSGYKYILTTIDCFSKFLYAYPLKSKKPSELIEIFKFIFENQKPIKLQSDQGKEFDNRYFKEFCIKNKVTYFTTKDKLIKCSIVERVNRTIKEKLFRYFTNHGMYKYIDVLQNLVNSYNNTVHSVTKMRPNEINISNEKYVFENIYGFKNFKDMIFDKTDKPKNNYKVGDNVRLKYDLSILDKSYYPLWTDQIYTIIKVLNKHDKPQYIIDDDKIGSRRFYKEDLQKVDRSQNTLYRVEKVIKTRIINNKKEYYVKWLNYPSKYNSWILETDVVKLK